MRLSKELFILFSPKISEILEESALQCRVHVIYVKAEIKVSIRSLKRHHCPDQIRSVKKEKHKSQQASDLVFFIWKWKWK